MRRILWPARLLDKMQNPQHIRYSRYRVEQGSVNGDGSGGRVEAGMKPTIRGAHHHSLFS